MNSRYVDYPNYDMDNPLNPDYLQLKNIRKGIYLHSPRSTPINRNVHSPLYLELCDNIF